MAPPTLCSICAIVPHWLASLCWDPTKGASEFTYSYTDTTVTLGSWRWMLAQAEKAEQAAAERNGCGNGCGSGGGSDELFKEYEAGEGHGGKWGKKAFYEVQGDGDEEGERNAGKGARGARGYGYGYGYGVGEQELGIGLQEGEGQDKGCDLCLMITKCTSRKSCYPYDARPYYLPPVMDPRRDERYRDVPLVFGRKSKKAIGAHTAGRPDEWQFWIHCLNMEVFMADVVVVPGSWCPKFSPPMAYNDQNPENNILLMKDWLENCRRNHAKCSEIKKTTETTTGADSFLPTRLLDVQAFGTGGKATSYLGRDVRLVSLSSRPKTMGSEADTNNNTKLPPYLTLSHCWGLPEKRPTTTTKYSLGERMKRIPLFELPRTFQDAIEITRKLGYRYLWIDSLCIVQDDEQDWAHEAGLMAKVYSHSSCTLSALSSHDSSEGLHLEPLNEDRSFMDIILPTPWPSSHPVGSTNACTGTDTDTGIGKNESDMDNTFSYTPRFRMLFSREYWYTLYNDKVLGGLCDDKSPLRSRAWTLQERELSRRVIHFAKGQVLWECAELKATAQQPWHDSSYVVMDPKWQWEEWPKIAESFESLNLVRDCDDGSVQATDSASASSSAYSSILTALTPSSLLAAYQSEKEWWDMVYDYSERLLSKDTDRLAALSGMAQFFQRNHFPHARYVAGLWSSRLEDELFWDSEDTIDARRPTDYVAPSWSWASVNGRVSFRMLVDPVRRFKKLRKKMLAVAAESIAADSEGEDGDSETENKDNDEERQRQKALQKVVCEGWKIDEVNVLPKYDDPCGALKGGSLIISGARLVEVEVFTETMLEPDPEYILGFHRHYGGLKIDGRWVADHRLDVPGEADRDDSRLVCLGMLAERGFREKLVIGGLLLRKENVDVDSDGGVCVYTRVGRFHRMAVEYFDGVEPRRIKLI